MKFFLFLHSKPRSSLFILSHIYSFVHLILLLLVIPTWYLLLLFFPSIVLHPFIHCFICSCSFSLCVCVFAHIDLGARATQRNYEKLTYTHTKSFSFFLPIWLDLNSTWLDFILCVRVVLFVLFANVIRLVRVILLYRVIGNAHTRCTLCQCQNEYINKWNKQSTQKLWKCDCWLFNNNKNAPTWVLRWFDMFLLLFRSSVRSDLSFVRLYTWLK